jgi:Phage integrase, N-terminal SAM-like domain
MRTRHTFQRGYVSEGFKTRRGIAYRIRYRVPTADEKWKHKSEVLYDLSGRKAARDVLKNRLQEALKRIPEAAELTVQDFVEAYWKPYLERRNVKPSTRKGYASVLNTHILPVLGDAERDKAAQQVKALDTAIRALSGMNSTRGSHGPRKMSAAARAKLAASQRARWAKVKGRKVVSIAPKRHISAAGLANIRKATKARWAKWRAAKK